MPDERPLAIDMFSGLGGWAEGLIAEGWRVIGVDIEDMFAACGAAKPEHYELWLRDVLTVHGAEFKDADLIVSSSPCTEYSYMAMPWSLAKARAAAIRADDTGEALRKLNALFDAQFRIQREASAAKGESIPMVVENVRGAQPWVGPAAWSYGSYYLWGDVPALMPKPFDARKNPGFRFDGSGRSFQSESVARHVDGVKVPSSTGRRTAPGRGARFTSRDCGVEVAEGRKGGGDWFGSGENCSLQRRAASGSTARKAASAAIAKIPFALSSHIARVYYPRREVA
jgi:hypothetical protein